VLILKISKKMKAKIKVDIVSDVVCPWCYIGKRRIEGAMKELTDQFDFEVSYLPFELNPSTPKEGFNQKEYLAKKFGSEERYRELTNHVKSVAASEGLAFDFDKQKVSPNTRDAHRIIGFAKQEGKQLAIKEAFMKAYFEEGIDLTKAENLLAVCKSVGLHSERISALLNSEEGLAEVILEEQNNIQRGINGVPYYIINNQYGISGAQPKATFIKALTQIGNESVASEGEACAVDGSDC
jgi:predicted DsbA family dithiol-disulfide isomerase